MNMVEILELGMGNPTKQIGRGKPSAVEAMGFSDYANYYILTWSTCLHISTNPFSMYIAPPICDYNINYTFLVDINIIYLNLKGVGFKVRWLLFHSIF